MAKGKRLTCPVCQDSSFFSLEQLKTIEEFGGKIQCDGEGRHVLVEMVDLVELNKIFGWGKPLTEEEEVDFNTAVDAHLIHPSDFEFEDWAVEFERDLI
jgi:hypothetical protein